MKLTYSLHGIESSLKIKAVVVSKKYLDKLYNQWRKEIPIAMIRAIMIKSTGYHGHEKSVKKCKEYKSTKHDRNKIWEIIERSSELP